MKRMRKTAIKTGVKALNIHPLRYLSAVLVLLTVLGLCSPVGPNAAGRAALLAALPKVQAADMAWAGSLEELESALSGTLHHREQNLRIRLVGDTARMLEGLPETLEGILQDSDYLRHSMGGWRWRWTGVPGDIRMDFYFEHLNTLEEDRYVRKEVERILGSILSPGMDDHQVVKAVHDYIVATVAYDTAYREYTAYGALSKGRAVCQGFALLTYKMLTGAGLEARIITGTAGGENHAWNLVQLEGRWYHLDCTWNSPLPNVPGRVQYGFYNRSDAQMSATHRWDRGAYPVADTPYQAPDHIQLEAAILTRYAGIQWPARGDTPADKTWTVRFNRPIDPRSVTNQTIFIAGPDANLFNIIVRPGGDGRSALISPAGTYPAGGTYYLLLSREISGQGGMGLERPAWMEFTVR